MDHSVAALATAGLLLLIAFAIGFAFAGGVVNGQARNITLASWLGRAAVILACLYPIPWAWRSPYPLTTVALAASIWGATFGAIFYAIGVWHRFEMHQLGQSQNERN